MTEFTYEALDEEQSATSGSISAESVSAAVIQLESQGLQVLSIQQVDSDTGSASSTDISQTANGAALTDDQQALCQRVAEVLEKRDVLAPALAAFAGELPLGRTRRELSDLVSRIQLGATAIEFCDSDDRSTSWLLLLGRGTNSQRLLCDLFDEATRENESHSQWNRAFIYPTFVLLASLAVLVFLCVSVVPTFTSIFDDFDLDLPVMTSWLVAISSTILRNPLGFAMGILGAVVAVYSLLRLIRTWGLPGRLSSLLTTGSSWQVTAMARFTRRLAEALDAGMKLPAALRLAGRAEGRGTTRQIALRLADDADQRDFDLSKSFSARGLPTTVAHALQAGSDNQPSIPLLRQLSELYSKRVRDRHNWSTGYMTHFAIIGIGITVGFVVIALFIPLVELVNGLTG